MARKSKDREATRAAKFISHASRVNLDGTVELQGADMAMLRAECFERDNWACTVPGCETPTEWIQLHHIIPKGSNGVDRDDRIDNVTTLCLNCHSKKHVRVIYREREAKP